MSNQLKILNGCKKHELYTYLHPQPYRVIQAEVWEVIVKNRGVNIDVAKNVQYLRKNEVEEVLRIFGKYPV